MKQIKPAELNESIVVLTREDKQLLCDILRQLDEWYCSKLDLDDAKVKKLLDEITDL